MMIRRASNSPYRWGSGARSAATYPAAALR